METTKKSVELSSFLTTEDVLVELTVPSTYNMVHALVGKIVANHLPGVQPGPIVDEVLRRERMSHTVIGEGVALPHARIEGLERPYMALGIYPAGIPSPDGEAPIRLVFLLLIPESQPARYLQILRAVATLLQVPGMTDRLSKATTGAEVLQHFRRNESHLPDYICAADLMDAVPHQLRAAVPLSAALDSFMAGQCTELPIVDEGDKLVGTIDTRALLGSFIPKGFRKLFPQLQETPAHTMAPLADKMREAHRTRVCEVMNTDVCTCTTDTPAREIAADLAERNVTHCYVQDREGRLVGVISVAGFFRRILKD